MEGEAGRSQELEVQDIFSEIISSAYEKEVVPMKFSTTQTTKGLA